LLFNPLEGACRAAVQARLSAALGDRAAAEALERLQSAGIGLVTFAGAERPVGHSDAVLELDADGSWSVFTPAAGQPTR
jgi:hypothetical protein